MLGPTPIFYFWNLTPGYSSVSRYRHIYGELYRVISYRMSMGYSAQQGEQGVLSFFLSFFFLSFLSLCLSFFSMSFFLYFLLSFLVVLNDKRIPPRYSRWHQIHLKSQRSILIGHPFDCYNPEHDVLELNNSSFHFDCYKWDTEQF